MKKFILLMDIMVLALGVSAQNVGIGTTSPNASALLHVDLGNSATKGLLVTGIITSDPPFLIWVPVAA